MIALSVEQHSAIQSLSLLGHKVGMRLFFVGGVVRDLLLLNRLDDNDFDLVVEGDGQACARELADQFGGAVKEFKDFLTAKVTNLNPPFTGIEVDFATARTEHYANPGSLPDVQPASIEDDLRRRDFSINAMALPIDALMAGAESGISKEELVGSLVDRFDGFGDLTSRRIRVLHDLSMIDDPTRAFRACRYAARIGGGIEQDTSRLITEMVERGGLSTISDFRKITELRKIFDEQSWQGACEQLHSYNVFSAMGLCQSGQSEQFIGALRNISLLPGINGSVRLRMLHLLTVHFLGTQGEHRVHELGYSRKKARMICELVSGALSSPVNQLTVEAAQFAFIIEANSVRRAELRNRFGA